MRGTLVHGADVMDVSGSVRDDFSPDCLSAANIHPDTRLATDYLNHFNEVVMLINMLPMMPDCAPDVVAWQPCSYVEHFRLSRFKDRDLAIRAYATVDPDRRAALEATIAGVERALGEVQRMIVEAPLDQAPVQAVQDLTEMRVKPLLSHAMGLINGAPVAAPYEDESEDTQSAIDALFE